MIIMDIDQFIFYIISTSDVQRKTENFCNKIKMCFGENIKKLRTEEAENI